LVLVLVLVLVQVLDHLLFVLFVLFVKVQISIRY
jgi:hypothetical protein